MSQHASVPTAERFEEKKAKPLAIIFKLLAIIGIVGSVAFFLKPGLGSHAWLVGFMYFFSILVGCFFWNCLHHATDAEWSVVVRRQIENLASLLRYIGVFFVPIACVLLFASEWMYDWVKADPKIDTLMATAKGKYLGGYFFAFRAVAFFGLLAWLSNRLRQSSMAQDKDGAAIHTFTMRKLSIAGIPAFAICLTFAGIDWLQTLNHHWYSTMWGVYIFAGAAGASMALIILTCKWLQSLGYLKPVTKEHYHLMGKFLLAFTVFWAYIGFSQYMLITYANIEEETIYFRLRNTGGWHWMSTFLVFGRFFFMFVPLLFQGLKKSKGIIFCAIWVLMMHFVDMFVIVMPEYFPSGDFMQIALGLFAAIFPVMGIAGCLGLFYLKNVKQGVTFPTKDPRLAESIKFSN